MLTTNSTSFVVKHIRTPQYIYVQLVKNPYNEEYNGAMFKLKFQLLNIKREFLTGSLLNSYLFLDK